MYPTDFFTDELIEAIYLEAEAAGQEPNQQHLASVRKHRALEAQEQERKVMEHLQAA